MPVTSVVTPTILTSVVTPIITKDQAIAAAFKYGQSLAGLDGTLVKAIGQFKGDTETLTAIQGALNIGYVMKKLDVSKDEATRIVGLMKHNDKKPDDEHRTFGQERIMIAARVLWSRAKAMAGVPKSEQAAKGEATRAQKDADRRANVQRLIKADAIVNPPAETDPFEALAALVTTMRHLQKKHAAKLVGERGTQWRDWLANAPK